MGYTHIDTAFDYNNQAGVGTGLKAIICLMFMLSALVVAVVVVVVVEEVVVVVLLFVLLHTVIVTLDNYVTVSTDRLVVVLLV